MKKTGHPQTDLASDVGGPRILAEHLDLSCKPIKDHGTATANVVVAAQVGMYVGSQYITTCILHPLAAESPGDINTGVIELPKLITPASNHLRLDPTQARVEAGQAAVAITVQRDNTMCMFAGMSRAFG
jgi:hypothetical protein